MSTTSEPGSADCPASPEYSIPAGYGTLRLREHAIPFGAYAEPEPAASRTRPDYRAQARENLARIARVRRGLAEDQREIDRLRSETRRVIDGLLAA